MKIIVKIICIIFFWLMKLVRDGMMYDELLYEGFLFGIIIYYNKIIYCSESNNFLYSY